jgi:hypothetical protein
VADFVFALIFGRIWRSVLQLNCGIEKQNLLSSLRTGGSQYIKLVILWLISLLFLDGSGDPSYVLIGDLVEDFVFV